MVECVASGDRARRDDLRTICRVIESAAVAAGFRRRAKYESALEEGVAMGGGMALPLLLPDAGRSLMADGSFLNPDIEMSSSSSSVVSLIRLVRVAGC